MAKQKGNKGGTQKKSKGKNSSSSSSASTSASNNNARNGKNNNNGNTTNSKRNKSRQQQHRHNKNNNYNDDSSDTSFRTTLLNQGNTIKEMTSDGNCLFRSLSDQLYHDSGSQHALVRNDVCTHLSSHKDEFEHFLLLDDDDEDVTSMEEYIERMREDGEWGGNVEIVVASRVYGRNIKVFSGEYANGCLSVVCENDNERDIRNNDEDLLLSYHGNDHYNSVHPVGGFKANKKMTTQSTTQHSNTTASSDRKKGKAATASTIDDKKENDNTTNNQMKLQLTTAEGNRSRTRPPTRGSNCLCGSGLKYKKCCMATEKSKKRLAKHLEKKQEEEEVEGDEKKEEEFIGEFKVLTI